MSTFRCFLSMVFTDGEKRAYELVLFSPNDFFSFEVVYLDQDGLKDLYNSGEYHFDFGIKNNHLIWEGETTKVSPLEIRRLLKEKIIYENSILGVNDLLLDLSRDGSFYLDYNIVEEIKDADNWCGDYGLGRMGNLMVSRSTMNVYLSLLTEEGWRTRSIIRVKDKVLTFNEFYFACSEEISDYLEGKYKALERKGVRNICGRKMVVFKLPEGLPIYPAMSPRFRLMDPMINYKIYMSERDRVAIDFLTYFINSSVKAIFPDQISEEEKEERTYPSRDEDSKFNVLFRTKFKNVSMEDKKRMLESCSRLLKNVIEDKWGIKEIRKYLEGAAYDSIRQYACVVLLKSLSSVNTSMLDRIDYAKRLREEIKLGKLQLDLELFYYRSFMYLTDYKFPYGTNNYFLTGGGIPYVSEIVKKLG